jgi:hypothetical protein
VDRGGANRPGVSWLSCPFDELDGEVINTYSLPPSAYVHPTAAVQCGACRAAVTVCGACRVRLPAPICCLCSIYNECLANSQCIGFRVKNDRSAGDILALVNRGHWPGWFYMGSESDPALAKFKQVRLGGERGPYDAQVDSEAGLRSNSSAGSGSHGS